MLSKTNPLPADMAGAVHKTQPKATRDGLGEALLELAKTNNDVVGLTANLKESTRLDKFAAEFPERFIEVGVAEQNLAGIAAGLALSGKIPFMTSFGAFSPSTNWSTIRVAICYNNANVKIASTHCGISVGADGAGHQMLEDIALMRVLPNMTVLAPADANEAKLACMAATHHNGPVYIRLGREPVPHTTDTKEFTIGKIYPIIEDNKSEITLLSTGSILSEAIIAAKILKEKNINISIYHCPTIKPLDISKLKEIAARSKTIFTIEEHQIAAGFGSAVMEDIIPDNPIRIIPIGIRNSFGESGKTPELFAKYGIDANSIANTIINYTKS